MMTQYPECTTKPSSPQVSWIQDTVQMLCKETSKNIFRSHLPQRILANFINRGKSTLEIKVATKKYPNPLARKIRAGAPFVEEFEQVTSIDLLPASEARNPDVEILNLDTVILYAEETQISQAFSLFLPTACMEDEVSRSPDSNTDCLWVKDTIWQSEISRDIDLEIEVTGNHDLDIELERTNGTFLDFKISAAPALPQFRQLTGEFEGIVAIRVKCRKSPVHACSACQYRYKICYPKSFGFVASS